MSLASPSTSSKTLECLSQWGTFNLRPLNSELTKRHSDGKCTTPWTCGSGESHVGLGRRLLAQNHLEAHLSCRQKWYLMFILITCPSIFINLSDLKFWIPCDAMETNMMTGAGPVLGAFAGFGFASGNWLGFFFLPSLRDSSWKWAMLATWKQPKILTCPRVRRAWNQCI